MGKINDLYIEVHNFIKGKYEDSEVLRTMLGKDWTIYVYFSYQPKQRGNKSIKAQYKTITLSYDVIDDNIKVYEPRA